MNEWDSKVCPMNDVQQATAQCKALPSLPAEYQNKQQIHQAETLTKDLPRRKALLELEGQIIQVYEQLSQIFDATSISQASSPQSSSAGKEDKPVANGALSSTRGLASPPLPFHRPRRSQRLKQCRLSPCQRPSTQARNPLRHSLFCMGQDDEDSWHPPLDGAARQYNPLTYAQTRGLAAMHSGVGFVFASEALGLSHIVEAYKRVVPTDMLHWKKVTRTEIPSEVSTDEHLPQWFTQYCQEHSSDQRVMTHRILGQCSTEQLRDQVQTALDQIEQTKKTNVQLSVLFFFDSRATSSWFSMPPDERTMLESHLKAQISPRRRNTLGIHQRLAQHGKLDTEETCEAILRASGG